jgi:hypothetical protein
MILYFNGDSFCAGVELGDDILPGYPGASDTHNHIVRRLNQSWINKTYDPSHPWAEERRSVQSKLTTLEYERAFPNKIQQTLGIPVINKSLGGSSMDRIVRTTITNLIEYKKSGDDVIAIIGLTDSGRSEIPNYSSSGHIDVVGFPSHWSDISLGHVLPGEDELEPVRQYNLRYQTNYHSQVSFYRNVVLLQDFCKLNNIPLFWISTGFCNIQFKDVEDRYKDSPDLLNLIEYANLEYLLDMTEIAKELKFKVICPSNHYSEVVHVEVAKRIVAMLKENGYV